MRISRSELEDRLAQRNARIETLTAERDAFKKDARACGRQILLAHGELSVAKDVIAAHLVGATHPETAPADVQTFALSLRKALEAVGVDLRIELARLGGVDL